MKTRTELIEVMARAIDAACEGAVNNQDFARQQLQWQESLSLATAALSAIEANGAAVVPVLPTQAMKDDAEWHTNDGASITRIYVAMIAASPFRDEKKS